MTSAAEKWLEGLGSYIVSGPNAKGEYRMRCPIHGEDKNPSASANPSKGRGGSWYCNKCEEGGSITTLLKRIQDSPHDLPDEAAAYNPFEDDDDGDDAPATAKEATAKERLNEGKVVGWHDRLMSDPALLDSFMTKRGLTEDTLVKFQIGYDGERKRFTIPIRDRDGNLVNVRRYRMGAAQGQKMQNALGHGSPPRLFPITVLPETGDVMVVEGELDALICIQNGFAAVSGTGGARRWDDSWSREFTGNHVYIMYDNDEDGRVGSKKAARSLSGPAASVHVMDPLVEDEKGDITDFFVQGGTASHLSLAMGMADPYQTPKERAQESRDTVDAKPVAVKVIGSMDSTTNGKPLEMAVTITGKKNPTYSVPYKTLMTCTLDAGPKCKICPMLTEWEGEHKSTVEPTNVEVLAQFIDAKSSQVLDVLRSHIGAQRCNRLQAVPIEQQTIEEIYVMGSVDRRGHEDTDYTQRRVYGIGRHDTQTNTPARIVGTTTPNPKTQRNEFFAWDLTESTTSLDRFEMTQEMRERLSCFQPGPGQSPIDKCWDIAQDLSANVTKIIGRERLHMAMDLAWHSVLHFPFDDKIISRGWVELLVVGDTRTGKSETAIRLSEHYGLGHIIGCEGATFAGLVGGVKEVGDSRVVNWGEITLNDRRLCVLDEASGLAEELIAQLSDVRSRGVAQITKIETQQTNARCRLVWISNPRQGRFIDEKRRDGIDIIEGVIGNPEDIARFDIAMSVSADDVDSSIINSPDRPTVPHTYTGELCNDLLLWAWSRRAEQVRWEPDGYRHVYRMAEKMGKIFVGSPPLIQRTNVREKIARLSVALAARTFSTDETGEFLVVTKQHVEDATRFLYKLYSYDNFGYLRISKRAERNHQIAMKNRAKIKKWLKEHQQVLEFLLDRKGSFRSQDLEEMAHMLRDEVNEVLGVLSKAKMISKDKSQIIIEPVLHEVLKQLDK